MTADNSLDALRREIDGIDDAIHDLLMRRTEVAERIRLAKPAGGVALRPGREAEILRRLMARHKGSFPRSAMVRLWREIFAAATSLQGPFSLAALRPESTDGYVDLAHDHFSSYTPLTSHQTPSLVIEAVTQGKASVGILPLPQPDDEDPWWPQLVAQSKDAPRIIGRIPFAGPTSGRNRELQAVVIGCLPQEKTARDRSFVVLDAEAKMDLAPLRRALETAGFKGAIISFWSDGGSKAPWLHLAEVEGFVAADDPRLKALAKAAGEGVQRAVTIGGYAAPFTAEELSGATSKPSPRRKSA
jgi:chorismate mutase/prephenate dehydratase